MHATLIWPAADESASWHVTAGRHITQPVCHLHAANAQLKIAGVISGELSLCKAALQSVAADHTTCNCQMWLSAAASVRFCSLTAVCFLA
jgi:hypothetical protein